ncbi:Xin actin-binding repeat-containing protein 1 [Dissostichus eleginoides]|uniref:Xin actin-binding repeat-containing protein 1 n=1 Tax=Dissostichus eleginoides TaxID=100907 RepID=A0AAD9BIU3_DISEL|nr:Xin actin-binding repeat-containing protein 1 [Dissostichus eleginoides]
MDWKSNLRRTQSLRSIPSSCDKPTWTEGRLRERITSVSLLVSRYQTTVEVSASNPETPVNNDEAKPKTVLKEIKPSILKSNETHLDSLMRRNDARELSRSNLTRSKSVGNLQSSASSIGALKALFESKGATQNKVRSPRAASLTSSHKAADIKPMVNGEGEEGEEPAPRKDAKTDHVTRKVVTRTRAERRKTIGGIDFERIAASQDDEKRRSIADFRDSSLIQSKCVSVKTMSALYLSKVVPQDSTRSLLKPEQDKSSQSGKRVQRTKMSEDSEQSKDDIPSLPSARHQQGPEDVSGAKLTQSMSLQLSKEKLHQQRAKCELKRLLKHTHPELKTLDGVVDEELAEVLSLETDGETGYEGEVLSRCLIFENCALTNKVSPYIPKKYVAEGTVERGDVSKSVFQEHEDRSCTDKTIGPSHDPNREGEEEMVRIDVQATRRRFESQSVNTSAPFPKNNCQGKVYISGDKKGAVQKQEFNMRRQDHLHTKSLDVINQPKKQGPCDPIIGQSIDHVVSTGETPFGDETRSIPGPEKIIKTSAALSQNNPFIPTNIEREHSFLRSSQNQSPARDGGEIQDQVKANVKNRAHLFESMPFDQIRNQNKDEIEWQVENIKETLNSLHQVNAIHSDGSIIEVNETMIAKKAKFTLSEDGPEIKYDEVAEGGAQNFILQLLPRSNLKPHITYLKEGREGNIEATLVKIPVQHQHFSTNQDTEFKTANMAQLVEDILNQDNSLRKGVIIQEDTDGGAKS